jgi:hypothetical protein
MKKMMIIAALVALTTRLDGPQAWLCQRRDRTNQK